MQLREPLPTASSLWRTKWWLRTNLIEATNQTSRTPKSSEFMQDILGPGYWVFVGPGSESTWKSDKYETENWKGNWDSKALSVSLRLSVRVHVCNQRLWSLHALMCVGGREVAELVCRTAVRSSWRKRACAFHGQREWFWLRECVLGTRSLQQVCNGMSLASRASRHPCALAEYPFVPFVTALVRLTSSAPEPCPGESSGAVPGSSGQNCPSCVSLTSMAVATSMKVSTIILAFARSCPDSCAVGCDLGLLVAMPLQSCHSCCSLRPVFRDVSLRLVSLVRARGTTVLRFALLLLLCQPKRFCVWWRFRRARRVVVGVLLCLLVDLVSGG